MPPSPADTPQLPWLPQQPEAFGSAQPRSGKGLSTIPHPSSPPAEDRGSWEGLPPPNFKDKVQRGITGRLSFHAGQA